MTEKANQLRAAQKATFVADYRRHGIIGPAADAAGVARSSILRWRKEDEEFHAACEDAFQHAIDEAEEELRARAIGRPDIVLHKGEVIWKRDPHTGEIELDDEFNPVPLTIPTRSDRLLEVYTRAHRPVYKEKSTVELSGPDGGPIPASVTVQFVDSNGEGGREKDPLE